MTMVLTRQRQLTRFDKQEAFRIATANFARKYEMMIAFGMSDEELRDALRDSFGIFNGEGGADELSVCWQGQGLRIWANWGELDTEMLYPIFESNETLDMAREFYQINNPWFDQFSLL